MVENSTEYMRQYDKNNKDKYASYYVTKLKCDVCDAEYAKPNYQRHVHTKKHLDKISQRDCVSIPVNMLESLLNLLEAKKVNDRQS